MGPTWPHLFLLVCKSKNAKNGILLKNLDLGGITLGDIIRSLVKFGLFASSSQTIRPKGLKFHGLIGVPLEIS